MPDGPASPPEGDRPVPTEPESSSGPEVRSASGGDPLREREVAAAEASAAADRAAADSQYRTIRIQLASTAIALFVALVATVTSIGGLYLAAQSTTTQAESSARQDRETRLATAMDALAADDPAARLGGFTLLQRSVEERMDLAEGPTSTPAEREDAVLLYASALDLLEVTLKSPARTGLAPEGRGLGAPTVPSDVSYVVNRLGSLLMLGRRVEEIRARTGLLPTNIDLARATLYRSNWNRVSFVELPDSAKYFEGIDLRGAQFAGSDWTGVTLSGASMQCSVAARSRGKAVSFRDATLVGADLRLADLRGADLTDADLTDADLRGANLEGTVLTDATLDGTLFDHSRGTPVGGPALGPGNPDEFTQRGCLTSPAGLGLDTPTIPGLTWLRPPGLRAPGPPPVLPAAGPG